MWSWSCDQPPMWETRTPIGGGGRERRWSEKPWSVSGGEVCAGADYQWGRETTNSNYSCLICRQDEGADLRGVGLESALCTWLTMIGWWGEDRLRMGKWLDVRLRLRLRLLVGVSARELLR